MIARLRSRSRPGSKAAGAPRHRARLVISGVLALVIAAAGGTAYALTRPSSLSQRLRPSGIPGSISTGLANSMAIDALDGRAAPGFTLTDQAGKTKSLASLRGKVVVLEFMDSKCTDICPVVSQEFRYAYRDLGSLAGTVVFAAVNANPVARSVRDIATFTAEHQLNTIPGWTYFTGPLPKLRAVWHDYNVTVTMPHGVHSVVHTSAIYFIDRQGRERYLADADSEEPTIKHHKNGASYIPGATMPAWGRGIADLARSLAG